MDIYFLTESTRNIEALPPMGSFDSFLLDSVIEAAGTDVGNFDGEKLSVDQSKKVGDDCAGAKS